MIVVHIGMGKSGSSTLQNFLRRNEEILRSLSIDYPDIGRKPGHKAHHNIANEIQDDRHDLFDPQSGGVSDLVCRVRDHGYETTILSSEMFKNAKANEIERLKTAFDCGDLRSEISIVMVIRNLLEFVRSGYLKMIKYGEHICDFDEYFLRISQKEITDYFEIGRRWADVFGWPSMRVRVLDPHLLFNGNLLDDFMQLVAPEVGVGIANGPKRTPARNISPGWKTAEAIRALYSGLPVLSENHPLLTVVRELGPKKMVGETARKVGDKRGWNEDKGLYMTSEQAEFCFKKYCETVNSFNTRLAEKLPLPQGLEASGFIARTRSPSVEMIPRTELDEFYEDMWFHISKKMQRKGHVPPPAT